MLTICALHQGTFKGTSSKETAVTSQHVLGYGEIEHVLAQAQQLATKVGQKLNDGNVAQLVADALQSCGSMSLLQCLHSHSNENADDHGHGHNGHKDNSQGKSMLAHFP